MAEEVPQKPKKLSPNASLLEIARHKADLSAYMKYARSIGVKKQAEQKAFAKQNPPMTTTAQQPIPQQTPAEQQIFNDDSDLLNPLEQEVIERDYTTQKTNPPSSTPEQPIPEPTGTEAGDIPPQQPQPERGNVGNGEALDDMSKSEKRKAAEATADSLLMAYCMAVPVPFKAVSKFNEKKIKELALKGRINLSASIKNPDQTETTVRGFIDNHNEKAEAVFTVTEETKQAIKEPLVEVLLKRELALTPEQRLLMAVGGHILTMSYSAYQLASETKSAIEFFERYREDEKRTGKEKPTEPEELKITVAEAEEVL